MSWHYRYPTIKKEKADNLKPEVLLQHQRAEVDMAALAKKVMANFHKKVKKPPIPLAWEAFLQSTHGFLFRILFLLLRG